MNRQNKNENTFDGTINISSNIKDNKNTIIGKFDLKDIFFILIAGIVGILILSLMLAIFSIRNMFLIFIVLAIFEVPIVTLGFFKIYNIPIIDYIKMKSKSDNKSYRKQIRKRKKGKEDTFILTICIDYSLDRLEQVMNEFQTITPYINVEIKIQFNLIFLTIEVENLSDVLYDKLFDYFIFNRDIRYISMDDIKNYETYIKSLKFVDKKYGKKQNKEIRDIRLRLLKLKKIDETNARYEYLTNRIIDIKDTELIKVYKFTLYKIPFDLRVFDELKSICSITIYVIKDSDKLLDLSYINTFVDITGTSDEIETKCIEIKDILNKHHILYKEISEEKVKDSLLFLLENRY